MFCIFSLFEILRIYFITKAPCFIPTAMNTKDFGVTTRDMVEVGLYHAKQELYMKENMQKVIGMGLELYILRVGIPLLDVGRKEL